MVLAPATNYLFLLVLLFAAALFTGRLIEIRVRREHYLRKHKPGTLEHKRLQKLTNPYLLLVSVVATALACAILILSLYENTYVHEFFFATIFVLAVIVLGFATIPALISRQSNIADK